MLDKDQKPVVKLSIHQTYGHVLRRALAIGVFKGLEEIRNSMVLETKRALTREEKLFIFNEQLQTEKMKTLLCHGVDGMMKMKHDIIDLVLLEYGLQLDVEELLFYHEVMDKILMHWADVIQKLIRAGKYGAIGQMLPIPKD